MVKMTFLEERDFSDVPLIPEYFRGKTVFITGGSGFIGKIIIEKLLYCCSDLDRIYILLKSKRGVKPEERREIIFSYKCFDRLRSEKPGLFESKVFVIPGDISEPNLGMSEGDRALIVNTTNIIFHSAASVSFVDPLKVAVKLNLLGTKRMIELAKEVINLECFVHVSTAYSNKHRKPIQETLYPPIMDWRNLLNICEIDDHTIEVLTPKLIDDFPNTYVLTKHLAEHMVYEEKGKLPIVIVRPSIVCNSLIEPFPGWTDNFNGPIGIVVAASSGLTSTLLVHPQIKSDYIPVDLVVRGIIGAAWVRGTKKFEPSDDISIYNACAGGHFNLSPLQLIKYGVSATDKTPLEGVIIPPSYNLTASRFRFTAEIFITRLLLFALIDLLLKLFSKKPKLIKLIRRLYIVNIAVQIFSMKEWTFTTDNFMKLRSVLKEGDKKEFNYTVENIEPYKYIHDSVVGTKVCLLKERLENVPKAREYNDRLKFSFMVMKMFFYSLLIWYIFTSNITKTYISKIIKF